MGVSVTTEALVRNSSATYQVTASIARRPLLSSTTSLRRYSSGESLSLVHGERPSMFAYLGANQPVSRASAAKFVLCAVSYEPGT